MVALLFILALIITIQFCKYRELEERLEKEIKHSVLLEDTIKEIIESKEN